MQNFKSRIKSVFRRQKYRKFQVARASWIGDYADPMTFMDVYLDENNDGQYHNPLYNDLVRKAQNTNNQEIRMQAMHEAEKS